MDYTDSDRDEMIYQNAVAERKHLIADQAKLGPCMDCGASLPLCAMDLDHRDPSTKRFEISKWSQRFITPAMLRTEIAKCDLVCSNCHRLRTHKARTVEIVGQLPLW